MGSRLFLLFVIVPFVELVLLIRVGEWIGFWPTVGLIVLTGLLGSTMARLEGLSVWQRLQDQLQKGGIPGKELMDGVIILVAGALLLTPGVLTDVVGLLGLFPPSRALIRSQLRKRFSAGVQQGSIRFSVFGQDPFAHPTSMHQGTSTPYSTANPSDKRDISNIVEANVESSTHST